MSEKQIKTVRVSNATHEAMAMMGRASGAHVDDRRAEEDGGSQNDSSTSGARR